MQSTPHITISYRRDDSSVISGRIFDRLVGHYGREAVFRDIDNIPAGVDFRKHIDQMLDASDVVLAIVGPRWVGPSETQNRLSNEADPVRVEIEGAFRKGASLIPVLVLGARMPTADQLPDTLKDFAYRNAVQIDAGQDFDNHMARLIRSVDGILGRGEARPQTAPRDGGTAPPPAKSRLLVFSGIGLVVAAMAVAIGWYAGVARQTPGRSDAPTVAATAAPPAPAPTAAPAAPIPAPAPASTPAPSIDAEMLFWQSISSSSNAADFEEYLRQYPQGRFAGLARNRMQRLTQPPPATAQPVEQPQAAAAVAPPRPIPVPAKCGGNTDERLLQPIKLLYQAINARDIDLYAAQWSADGVYRDLSNGTVRTRADKIAERRARFTTWEQVRLTMDSAAVTERSADNAKIRIVYSMLVKNYGRPPVVQNNVSEDYVVTCTPDGRWLIQQNIDENR